MPKGEVLTRTIIYDALRQGKQIYVPYIYDSKVQSNLNTCSAMNMVSLHSKSDYEALEPDNWGIPSVVEVSITERIRILEEFANSERNTRSKSADCRRLDLIVMPGVAFDRNLGRLGHGKGFYDLFLECYHDSKICRLGEEIKMPFLGACLDSLIRTRSYRSFAHNSSVGLALDVQLLPNKIPTDNSDWSLDALVVGDGSVIRS